MLGGVTHKIPPVTWLSAPLQNIVLGTQVCAQERAIRAWAQNELDGYRYRAENLTAEDRAHIRSLPQFAGVESATLDAALELIQERLRLDNKISDGVASLEDCKRLGTIDRTVRGLCEGDGQGDELFTAVSLRMYTRVLLFRHISRQCAYLNSPEITEWCEAHSLMGFHRGLALAAVVGSDITKFSEEQTATWVQEAIRLGFAPKEANAPFKTSGYTVLRLHSLAGAAYTYTNLKRFLQEFVSFSEEDIEAVCRHAGDAVIGHDSFRQGFGRAILRPALEKIEGFPRGLLDYEISRSPCGFLVQVLDRIEATLPETLLRYTVERLTQGRPFEEALETALFQNAEWLRQVQGAIEQEATLQLQFGEAARLLDSPLYKCFLEGLEALEQLSQRFRRQPDGWDYMASTGVVVPIRNYEELGRVLLPMAFSSPE